MAKDPYRWRMTAPKAPMARAAWVGRALGSWGCPPEAYPDALELVLEGKVKVKPFVEPHPLSDIDRVFAAVHHREITRRAVLVPNL